MWSSCGFLYDLSIVQCQHLRSQALPGEICPDTRDAFRPNSLLSLHANASRQRGAVAEPVQGRLQADLGQDRAIAGNVAGNHRTPMQQHFDQDGRHALDGRWQHEDIGLCRHRCNLGIADEAMAASKLEIAVAHVEAGLRSRDRSMPEEVNRVLIDHLSDYLFCPTALQAQILRDEGLTGARIRITGNTVADATLAHAQTALRRSTILQRLGLREGGYHLLTCHRRSNTEDPAHFAALMQAVTSISEDQGLPLVFPMHPRLDALGSVAAARHRVLRAIGPVGYLDMLALQQGAALIMTDSGGIQEEACILQRKCLVLRTNTERPETLQIGGAELPHGLDQDALRSAADRLLARSVAWRNPFGDGHAFRCILDTLLARDEHPSASRPRLQHA